MYAGRASLSRGGSAACDVKARAHALVPVKTTSESPVRQVETEPPAAEPLESGPNCHDGLMSGDTNAGYHLTESGHHVVVNGRRWRATDPSIPAALREELVAALMAARRAVRTNRGARPAVHDAKVALGERGEPWWEPTTPEGRVDRLQRAARALLRHRGDDGVVTVEELATLSPGSGIELADAQRAVDDLTGKTRAKAARRADLPAEGR